MFRLVGLLAAALVIVTGSDTAFASEVLPAAKLVSATLVSPTNAWSGSTARTEGLASWGAQTPPEIAALARSLQACRDPVTRRFATCSNDQYAQNVLDYIRNNIAVEFRFGLGKGGRGALIDQSGTPFDQAELMVRLLRAGGVAASYQTGSITLSAQQFGQWTGLVKSLNEGAQTFSVDARAACQLLADGGIPAVFAAADCAGVSGDLSSAGVTLSHIWVLANGKAYDPSLKVHTLKAGLDVPAIMGCGSSCASLVQAAAMDTATTGAGLAGMPYIQNVNYGGLSAELKTQAVRLQQAIQAKNGPVRLEDVVGGRRLELAEASQATAALSYGAPGGVWSTDIPDAYRTTLRVRNGSGDATFFMDELAGRRLQLVGVTPLRTGGYTIDSVFTEYTAPQCASCNVYEVFLDISHPYAAQGGAYGDDHAELSMWDDSGVFASGPPPPGHGMYPVTIIHGLGTSGASSERQTAAWQEARPSSPVFEIVQTGNYTITSIFQESNQSVLAAKLLAQGAAADTVIAGLGRAPITRHHDIGIVYARPYSPSTFSFVSLQSALSVNSATNDNVKRGAAFEASAATWAMLEASTAQQATNAAGGAATAASFWSNNIDGKKFYNMTAANSTGLSTGILNAYRAYLTSTTDPGYEVIIPETGGTQLFYRPGATAYLINGAVKGGANIDNNPTRKILDSVIVNEAAAGRQKYLSASPADGAATLTAVDLTTGVGDFPKSLSLQRTYRSDVTVTDQVTSNNTQTEDSQFYSSGSTSYAWRYAGPDTAVNARLGGGWTHNFNITAEYVGDGYKGLGSDAGIDAAAAIASLQGILDLTGTPTFASRLTAVFAVQWLSEQLAFNSVVVNKGGETDAFQRLADGSFGSLTGRGRLTQTNEPGPGKNWTNVLLEYTGGDGDVIKFTPALRSQSPYCCGESYIKTEPLFKAIEWKFPDGVRLDFTYSGQFLVTSWGDLLPVQCTIGTGTCSGTLISSFPYGDVLTKVSNNLGRSLTFTNEATMTQVVSSSGMANESIPSSFRVTRVTDESGRHVDYAVSNCNGARLACGVFTVTAPDASVTKYDYQAGGDSPNPALAAAPGYRLRRIFTPKNAASAAQVITYDSLFHVKDLTDINSHVTRVFTGGVTGSERWKRGATVTPSLAINVDVFDTWNNPLISVNPNGFKTQTVYDDARRKIKETRPEGDYTTWTYDVRSNILQSAQYPKPDPAASLPPLIVSSGYGEGAVVRDCAKPAYCNKVTSETNARAPEIGGPAATTTYTWDDTTGLPTQILQPAVYSPADGGDVSPRTDLGYQSFGDGFKLLTSTSQKISNAQAVVSSYSYDPNNKFVQTSATVDDGGLGLKTTLVFDTYGDLTAVDGPRTDVNDVANYVWDTNNRRLSYAFMPPADGSGAGSRTASFYHYDADGYLDQVSKGTATSPDAGAFVAKLTMTFGYDGVGNRLHAITPTGVTQYSYDADDRLDCTAVRMNPATFYSQPNACLLTADPTGDHDADRITQTLYDPAGQVETILRGVGTDKLQAYARYAYTPNGKQAWVKDASGFLAQAPDLYGNRTSFNYDRYDRLARQTFPDKTAAASSPSNVNDYEAYDYDANGNRTLLRKRDNKTFTYVYDALDRQTVKRYPNDAAKDVYTDYDLAGRTVSARFQSRSGPGVLSTYDKAGRRVVETTDGLTVGSDYNAAGQRRRVTWPDGAYVEYDHDAAGHLTAVREPGGGLSGDRLAGFTYDGLGRREGGLLVGGAVETTYQYDASNGLLDMLRYQGFPGGQAVWQDATYNAASQVASVTQHNPALMWTGQPTATTAYVANGLNQDAAIAAMDGYDLNGNLTNDGTRQFQYDAENRLVTVSGASNLAIAYDPLGRIETTVAAGTTTRFLYDGDQLLGEYAAGGTTLRRYVHGDGTDDPLVWYEGAGTSDRHWLIADRQGSIVADATLGAAPTLYTYGPYGEPQTWAGSRFRYTGQIALPQAELYYYKARVYNPKRGWFLQTDPTGYDDGLNWYVYVGNDPLNGSDPAGTESASFSVYGRSPATQSSSDVYDQLDQISQMADTVQGTLMGMGPPGAVGSEGVAVLGVPIRGLRALFSAAKTERAVTAVVEAAPTAGKAFTRAQKAAIYAANRAQNGGELRSAQSGKLLVPSLKSERGVTPPTNAAQIDHKVPRSKGGTNDLVNGEVLSREENIKKSNR